MTFNSHSFRKLPRRYPGGNWKIASERKKPSMSICASTGSKLHGVPKARGTEMSRIEKSKRRPERPYGGILSSREARLLLIKKARGEL